MLKIDIHTHILPRQLPPFKEKFGYGGFIKLQPCADGCNTDMLDDSGKFFRKVAPNCFDGPLRLKESAAVGVKVQVLSTVPVMFSYWTKPKDGLEVARYLNDQLAEVVHQNPRQFVGLGTVPLQDPALAIEEGERCLKKLGLRGFQIGSHVNQWNLSAPELFPFFQACEKWNAPIFVHPWDMVGQGQMTKYWLPWLVGMPAETALAICSMIFGGVFERLPQLRVAFAHGGGAFPFTLGRIQHGFECRPDLCAVDCKTPPKDFIGKFFVDTLVHDPAALKYLVKLMGAEHVCLGTDYPFPLGETTPGKVIEEADFDTTTREWLFHKTALSWLGMSKSDFEK